MWCWRCSGLGFAVLVGLVHGLPGFGIAVGADRVDPGGRLDDRGGDGLALDRTHRHRRGLSSARRCSSSTLAAAAALGIFAAILTGIVGWLISGRYREGLPIYATGREIVWHYAFRVLCALVFLFLIAPILIVFPLSFNSQPYFSFTEGMLAAEREAYSFRWYADIIRNGMAAPDSHPTGIGLFVTWLGNGLNPFFDAAELDLRREVFAAFSNPLLPGPCDGLRSTDGRCFAKMLAETATGPRFDRRGPAPSSTRTCGRTPQWIRAIKNSFYFGFFATLLATSLGTLAAIGLSRSEMPYRRRAIMALLISPMVVPLVIIGAGMFFFFSKTSTSPTGSSAGDQPARRALAAARLPGSRHHPRPRGSWHAVRDHHRHGDADRLRQFAGRGRPPLAGRGIRSGPSSRCRCR